MVTGFLFTFVSVLRYDAIQLGINKLVTFENYCRTLLNKEYTLVLNKLKPMLEYSNIFIARGEEVKLMYPLYQQKKYFWEVGKQAAINLEFALEKKLSYDGKEIKFEDTYIDWVGQILNSQREKSNYNSKDKLLYNCIEPQATLKHVETREIILKETENYVKQFRQQLQHGNPQ